MEKTKYKNVLQLDYKALNLYLKTRDTNLPVNQRIRNFLDFFSFSLNKALYTKSMSQEEYDKESYKYHAFVKDLNKQLPHYFIENNSLSEFLKTPKFSDLSTIIDFINKNAADQEHYRNFEKNGVTVSDTRDICFAIHSPENAFLVKAITSKVKINDKTTDQYYLIVWDSNDEYQDIHFSNEIGKDKLFLSKIKDFKNLVYAVNSLLYISAFPECVRDGVPQNMPKNDREKMLNSNNMTLKISEQIVEKCDYDSAGNIITPHFRKGSFHYLKSDYYKNDKGKVKWWSPSMVRGKAKTIKNNKSKDLDKYLSR